MSDDQTATRTSLREQARQAAERAEQERRRHDEEQRVFYDRDACLSGVATFRLELGVVTEPEQWTPIGDRNNHGTYSYDAVTEIDGLRFRAHQSYYHETGLSSSVFLLKQCENTTDPPHDKQTKIDYLPALHDALEQDAAGKNPWDCPTCRQRAEEVADSTSPPVPATPAETPADRLLWALREIVREEIDARQEY
jgi:hypothetical protein